tara:strand:+ start:6640 stop:7065 length:426 start_codon:yes stop_codon:yes gene_type:complete
MAYDTTLPAGGPGNFVSPNSLFEAEGVGITFISVDFVGGTMAAEITDPRASAATGGIRLAEEAIQNQGVNILGRGILANSGTEMTFMVRTDALDDISSTTTIAAIQTAIQGLDALTPDKVTQTISAATAQSRGLSATAVGA